MFSLFKMLKEIKTVVRIWEKKQKAQKDELIEVDQKINEVFHSAQGGILSNDDKATIGSLSKSKEHLLRCEEESWRFKSRTVWTTLGDNNTYFFHKFVEIRRIINTAWESKIQDGQTIST